MVELPRFMGCCFCFSLRTGSLIIGYVSLVVASLSLSGVSTSLYRVVKYVKQDKYNDPKHSPEQVQRVAVGLYISHAYFLLVFTYYFAISLLLIVGIYRNKPKFLRYYFNAGAFLLMLGLTLVIVSFVFMGVLGAVPVLKWCGVPMETPSYQDVESLPYCWDPDLEISQFIEIQPAHSSPQDTTCLPGPSSVVHEVLSGPDPTLVQETAPLEEKKTQDSKLDDDILQLLGDAPKDKTSFGPPIHEDIASRWQDILLKGLPKELKNNLRKEYLVPSNCDLLQAPLLNPEVKAALHDPLIKKDLTLMFKQNQLASALSALAQVTDTVVSIEEKMLRLKILKPLSDACRIICDSHYMESKTRRNFVISSINVKLKQTLIDSTRDKLLFGENVSDKLKAAKTIQQSAEALKNTQKTKFQRPNIPSTSGNKAHLNFVPQHRKTEPKTNENRRVTRYPPRQMQNSDPQYRRSANDRPSTSRVPTTLHRR